MRKFVISLITAALLAAGAVTGTAGLVQAGAAHAVTHTAPQAAGGGCSSCRIGAPTRG